MPHLTPAARDVWDAMFGSVQELDALFADLSRQIDVIVRSYPDRPLTSAESRSMMRRIDRKIENMFGLSRHQAIQSNVFGTITRATDMAAEAPFRRFLDDIERGITKRDPALWSRIHNALMSGGNGPGDTFAKVYGRLNGPFAEKQRFLRSGLMDPQRRWVPREKWTTQRGYRLSDRVWRQGRGVRGHITREIRSAIRNGDGPITLANALERYLNPAFAPTIYRANGEIVRRNMTNRPTGSGYGSSYARMLARTEIQRVHHAATRELMRSGIPGSLGVKWNLSNAHPRIDICDEYATSDAYELGPGTYPAEDCPEVPHPQCMCHLTPVMKSREDVLDDIVAKYAA